MKSGLKMLAVPGLAAFSAAQTQPVCQKGVHIIAARASGEPAGFGGLVILKNQILAQIPDSDAIAVPYPASIGGAIPYTASEPEGVGNATILVKRYGDACPDSKMVLLGYSQGAQVVADTLLGIDYERFPAFGTSPGLPQKYIDQIVAVVMMGDPSHVNGEPVSRGTSTRSGFFPRNDTAKWTSTGLVNKTVSYCDSEDYFCDSGNSIQVHVSYIAKYGIRAVDYVVSKFRASSSDSSSASGDGSTTMSGASASGLSTMAPSATTPVPNAPTSGAPTSGTPAPSSSASGTGSSPSQGSASSGPSGANAASSAPSPTGTNAASTLDPGSLGNMFVTLLGSVFAIALWQ